MKIAIIGATGFVGAALLKEALSRGNEVTAIVRDLSKLEQHEGLTIEQGDINQTEELAELLVGHDVVLSAFNPGWTNPNIHEDYMVGAKSIEEAAVNAGVPRLLVIGGAGSLFIDGKQIVDGPNFPATFYGGASAARDYFNILKQNTTLDWTMFSPAIEMHHGITTGRTGKYRVGTDSPVFNEKGRSILSVQDLAVAVIDELENKQFIRQRFTAAY